MLIGSGIKISPQQVIAQWRTLPNKFSVNTWNFEIKVGKEAVGIFQESFYLGRFNSSGESQWKERKRSYKHPILQESGSLKRSIKYKHIGTKGRAGSGVSIYTDPSAFRGSFRHKGFCYAAVHNAPSGSYTYGATGARSIQRQFIGHPSKLQSAINNLSSIIFHGFPQ